MAAIICLNGNFFMDKRVLEQMSIVGTKTTCSGVAIIRDGSMLIGLRNYTVDKWKEISLWTVPGGRCDEGETIGRALRRETTEETGIERLKITDFIGKMPGAKPGDEFYLFVGSTDEDPRLMEPEKFSEWKWCALNEIPKNFINPTALDLIIRYAKT